MYPRLFHIGSFTLYSFGLMVILGFAAGTALAARLARRRGLPGDAFLDAAIVILFAGVAGARLLFVALNWKVYAAHPREIFEIWNGGMSFHGGVIAGVAAGLLHMRRQGLPVLAMADAAAPGLALGYAIGRIGCFLNGCCYGSETLLPWGVPGIFCVGAPSPELKYHPTQIYALITNLVLTVLLVVAYRRPHRSGQVLALYVAGYSIYRFAIESLRKGVTADVFAFGLTQAQAFSVLTLVIAVVWWAWLQQNSRPAPELTNATPATPSVPA